MKPHEPKICHDSSPDPVFPHTGAVTEATTGVWGSNGRQKIQKQHQRVKQAILDEVWINGGPNIEIENSYRDGFLNATYSVRSNKDYQPFFTPTNANQLLAELNAAFGAEREGYDIICYWLFPGNVSNIGGVSPTDRRTVFMLSPDDSTLAHEIGHSLGLKHPWDWISTKNTPADSAMMIMGYYDGKGFPFSQTEHVRK